MSIPASDSQQHQVELARKLVRLQEAEELIGWIFDNSTAGYDEVQSKCAAFLSIPLGRYGETLPEHKCEKGGTTWNAPVEACPNCGG